jgi:hypothetical protein
MTKKCTKSYADFPLDEGAIQYGIVDQKGRSVGYQWNIRQVHYTELAEGEKHYGFYIREDDLPMDMVQLWGRPTRDGKGYGPSFNRTEFVTLEAARRAAVKRVEQARKRDTKKFAKVPA